MHAPMGGETCVIARSFADVPFVLVVAPHDMAMTQWQQSLSFFAFDKNILTFPSWDVMPYDYLSPAISRMAMRLASLGQLKELKEGGALMVTTLAALTQRIPPADATMPFDIKDGCSFASLAAWLDKAGYEKVEIVFEVGQYAVRGGLIDFFPVNSPYPLRADFFGDHLESLRLFEAQSQKSIKTIDHHRAWGVREWRNDDKSRTLFKEGYHELGGFPQDDAFYDEVSAGQYSLGGEHHLPLFYPALSTLWDVCPSDMVMILPFDAHKLWQERLALIHSSYEARRDEDKRRPLAPDQLYVSDEELQKSWALRTTYEFTMGQKSRKDVRPLVMKQGSFTEQCTFLKKQGRRIIFAMNTVHSVKHLPHLLKNIENNAVATLSSMADAQAMQEGEWAVAHCPLAASFMDDDYLWVTEQDLFGKRGIRQTKIHRKSKMSGRELTSFEKGALLVHEAHGVGRYEGLQTLNLDGAPHDCILLSYKGGDELLIPIEHIGLLSQFGQEEGALDQLGSVFWQKRKAQAKERIGVLAHQLMELEALRQKSVAPVLRCDDAAYEEFCARFPHEPTEDQEQVFRDCEDDLASPHPTDRLICGDTGFGKTECALRASFIAVASGHQVMLLAPTTLLAHQHFRLFQERFAGFGARLAHISRMAQGVEKNIKAWREGKIDIAIGTHRLLKASASRLGLLIIDEEQHFGVAQKEKMKSLKANAHVMTLTATPIPRTLHMAMSGLRVMSLIETPPPGRIAVRTFVMPFDGVVLREALRREKKRGGQSYYIVPRIADMDWVQTQLSHLVPELRVTHAHGAMTAGEMDMNMRAFYQGHADILLATAIVEAGLDVPCANTIIVHRSERFGLAQLYQLRGRVGRGTERGWAYLTLPQGQPLSEVARRRLDILHGLDELGAGLTIASHDRNLRGAGNLLGEQQSGHIREIGLDLYEHMLKQELSKLKKDTPSHTEHQDEPLRLHLGVPMLIPDNYIAELNVRLRLYRRLGASSLDELRDMESELKDRFGAPPREVLLLLKAMHIRLMGIKLGLAAITYGKNGVMLNFREGKPDNPEQLIAWIERNPAQARPDNCLLIKQTWDEDEARLDGILDILNQLKTN